MAAFFYFVRQVPPELRGKHRLPQRVTWIMSTILAWGAFLGGTTEIQAAKTSLALRRPVTATWSGQSLGKVLPQIAAEYGIPLWLDRRIDPNRRIELKLSEVPLLEALQELTRESGATAQSFRGLVYIGPPETTIALEARASAMRSALQRLPPLARKAWLRSVPWSCPRLSEPRSLLVELAAAAKTEWENPAEIPHDLWNARSLPAMARIDQAMLLLAGFDLQFETTQSGRLRIVTPSAAASSPVGKSPEMIAAIKPAGPNEQSGRQVDESPSDKRRSPRPNKPDTPQALKRITLQVKNQPLGAILDELAEQLDFKFEPNAQLASTNYRRQLASCQVKQAGIDETLDALLSPLGIGSRRVANVVELFPKKAEPNAPNSSLP